MTTTETTPILVRTEVRGAVLVISMDAPAAGNALTVAMTDQLADALEKANGWPAVNSIVLRSTGKHFCTGGNVKDMRDGKDLMEGSVADVREKLRSTLHRITRAMHSVEVPTIAAVNGMAIGAGCDLALMCDIRIASERAQFAESFLRLGLVSGIGGAWFLTRLVGPSKAMEMTLTSEFLDAESALRHGIVSKVVADAQLDQVVAEMAERIASSPPTALRMAKQLVRASASSDLSSALELAASMQAILLCGEEHKGAVNRFLEAAPKS
ncbi:enoyl-CoA hydratase-related protein [Polaromonas sp. JS666]|uniref:enoyl-CoA hydratase-related protein n=1 Tax=Polaromonas sp. (strain JS666 / ATCC BAA-500) TaxID=296591 RepID=UPI0000537602|nr:enoyl-CoA hydratase-related protein [Polaromonas sp. JS666]ABE46590.1 Enoyl-CoA hydratase [Polaromonas sp. JS666]